MIDPTDHDGPGTPLGRLRVISDFAEERLGHSPCSSKPAEAVVLETLDHLLKEQAAGISWSFTAPINPSTRQNRSAQMPQDPLSNLDHVQSARIGELIITVHQAADAEIALLRQELANVKAAWRDLWEKAGCPAGVPE